MEDAVDISLTVNGGAVRRRVEPRVHLVDFLREELGLTGSHVGCEHGVCGACTVRVDGKIVRGCLMLAVQADGCRVDTVEGLTDSKELSKLQKAFHEKNALQCGFCTPGMLMAAKIWFSRRNPFPGKKFEATFPETTAAAPGIRRSWTPSTRW